MAKHNDFGHEGEEVAVEYLRSKGYEICHRNWMSGQKELDIVAKKDGMLVIIEVKTRANSYFNAPEDSVNEKKIRNIVHAAEDYIFTHDLMMETRFDIVSVIPNGHGGFSVEHIEDAFLPPVN